MYPDEYEQATFSQFIAESEGKERVLLKKTVQEIEDVFWAKIETEEKSYAMNNEISLFGNDVALWNLDRFTRAESNIHSSAPHQTLKVNFLRKIALYFRRKTKPKLSVHSAPETHFTFQESISCRAHQINTRSTLKTLNAFQEPNVRRATESFFFTSKCIHFLHVVLERPIDVCNGRNPDAIHLYRRAINCVCISSRRWQSEFNQFPT